MKAPAMLAVRAGDLPAAFFTARFGAVRFARNAGRICFSLK